MPTTKPTPTTTPESDSYDCCSCLPKQSHKKLGAHDPVLANLSEMAIL